MQVLERIKGLQQHQQQEQEQLRGILLDPITQELVCDPVCCSDGYTYDRFTILNHEGGVVSPFDGQQLHITGVDDGVAAALPAEQLEQQRVRRYVRILCHGGAFLAGCRSKIPGSGCSTSLKLRPWQESHASIIWLICVSFLGNHGSSITYASCVLHSWSPALLE